MSIPHFLKLYNGTKFPTIGLGTYMLKGDVLKEALDYALFLGYRHIDTAASYKNEAEIGEVLHDRIRAGKLLRKDIFVTTKIPSICLEKSDAIESAHKSLSLLKMKSIDMFLIHHPWGRVNRRDGDFAPLMPDDSSKSEIVNVDFTETWAALEFLVKDNFAKNIGVSNFTVRQLQRVLDKAKIPIANVQLECHAYYQQHELKSFCDTNNIVLSAYAPIGAPGREAMQQVNTDNLMEDPLVVELAVKYKRTPAQILLNFLLKRGMAVLPKSSSKVRLKENFDSLSFELSDSDLATLFQLDKGIRFFQFMYIRHHPEFFEKEQF